MGDAQRGAARYRRGHRIRGHRLVDVGTPRRLVVSSPTWNWTASLTSTIRECPCQDGLNQDPDLLQVVFCMSSSHQNCDLLGFGPSCPEWLCKTLRPHREAHRPATGHETASFCLGKTPDVSASTGRFLSDTAHCYPFPTRVPGAEDRRTETRTD